MDYVWFSILVLVLVGSLIFIKYLDRKAKARNREEAYRVLDLPNPSEKDLKNAIQGLHLYGGRLRKDKEFVDLKERLAKKASSTGR